MGCGRASQVPGPGPGRRQSHHIQRPVLFHRSQGKEAGIRKGQRVQGLSGAAIPAYKGLEDTWISAFDQYDYKLDVQKCVDMFPYGVQSVNNASRPNWKTQINDLLLKIYSGELSLDQGLEDMQKLVDEAKAP